MPIELLSRCQDKKGEARTRPLRRGCGRLKSNLLDGQIWELEEVVKGRVQNGLGLGHSHKCSCANSLIHTDTVFHTTCGSEKLGHHILTNRSPRARLHFSFWLSS